MYNGYKKSISCSDTYNGGLLLIILRKNSEKSEKQQK